MTYVTTPDMTEIRKVFKKRVYDIMSYLDNARHNPPARRIAQKHPDTPWGERMGKPPRSRLSDTVKSTWFAAIHDIMLTNDRLAAIHQSGTSSC